MAAKFISKARITKQGQLTIPSEARADLKIGLNSDVYWYELNDALVLTKNLVTPDEIIGFIINKKKGRK